jgi:hypothetical protein
VFTSFRRQRKIITSFALVVWLFALFIGIAHACGLGEPTMAPPDVVVANPSERPADTGTPDACEQFCKTDVPVVSKLQFLGDQPDAPPLIIAVHEIGVAVALPPALRLAPAAHPPPDVAAFLRFAHLRL